ncbi:MAG: hypothetical protein AB7E85_02305 [Pseudobdellovibrionaceae bacterium]
MDLRERIKQRNERYQDRKREMRPLMPFFVVLGATFAFMGAGGFEWIGQPLNMWVLLASWFPYAAVVCVLAVLLAKRVKPDIGKIGLFGAMGFFCLLSVPLFLLVNKSFDSSLEDRVTRTVIAREEHTGSKGAKSHYAIFDGPLLMKDLGGAENKMRITNNVYRSIVPERTKVELRIKDGFLGVKWLAGQRWTNLKAEDTPQSHTNAPENSVEREAAIQWTNDHSFPTEMSFDPETQANQQQKWPNGKIMQMEPLEDGRIHGVAGYWFDNGQLYGYIPYQKGKKYGCFRLYRDNGNLDQDLCYKDGELYGICRWYNPDGSLLGQALYYDGKDHPL